MPANVLAILISLVMFVPVYLLFVNSLKDEIESRAMGVELPNSIHLENYLTVIEQGKLGVAFANSMLYALGATIIVVILSTAAAFVLSRNRSPRNRFIYLHYPGDCNADKLCNINEGDASNRSDQYSSRDHNPVCSYKNSLWSFPDLSVY